MLLRADCLFMQGGGKSGNWSLFPGERTSGLDMSSRDMGSTKSQDNIGRTFSLYMSQPRHWYNYISGHDEDIQLQNISVSARY